MSIRTKLTLLITLVVTIVLSLNISAYYYSTKRDMRENARQQMQDVAMQVNASVQSTQEFRQHMEDALAEKIRLTAIAAKQELDPRADNVTNEQLAALSERLGVEGITLWQRKSDGDIVVSKSSAPEEVGMSSKTWSYWFTAFNELFDHRDVQTVSKGERMPHFWSGPINFATSDPSKIYKWGNYYDGTTDYLINPFVDGNPVLEFEENSGTNAVIRTILRSNPNILEISGIDPEFFGKPIIWRKKQGQLIQNLDVRQVPFGTYKLQSESRDAVHVKQAVAQGELVLANEKVTIEQPSGASTTASVIKSFLPIQRDKTYVVGVSFDRKGIDEALRRQLTVHSFISLVLILATLIASYFVSGFLVQTLNRIVRKVNEIASGNFGTTVVVKSKDELGTLASSVNLMSGNLHEYTNQITDNAEELRSMKEYLESFVGNTSDAIHVTDLKGNVLSVNKAFESMFGWQLADLLGQCPNSVPIGSEEEAADIRNRVLRGEPVADFETVRLRKDGRPIDLSITVSGIRDKHGAIISIATISRNITARKHTEEVIRRSEKLSIIGQLAAGVAHEIRNPLTTLRGFVQLMKQKQLSEAHMDIMMSELDRINFIVGEFLVLSKPQVSRYRPADLTEIVSDLLLFLDSQANMSNVQFVTEFPEKPVPNVICEPNQLKQVFLNILKNAMEAMEGGGTIRIELLHRPAVSLTVRVTDEGCGIAPEELRRLGEPFFTKKSSGNGLGLMVSQQIIANHKGTITFRSQLDVGTSVEVCLPLSDPQQPEMSAPPPDSGESVA
ncbi:ATP-binding protein [Cohnella sp. GCM10027633]|uniref:ATP-binding protein n=1 Tax=unclassified Cohnella TaxID=2636738 RepID=UPI0036349C1D